MKYANEDPLVFGEKYGVIHNAGVRVGTLFPRSILLIPDNGVCSEGPANDHPLERPQLLQRQSMGKLLAKAKASLESIRMPLSHLIGPCQMINQLNRHCKPQSPQKSKLSDKEMSKKSQPASPRQRRGSSLTYLNRFLSLISS